MADEQKFNNYDSEDQRELIEYLGLDSESSHFDDDPDEEVDGIYSDDAIDDIDFSAYSGGFKKSFRRVNRRIAQKGKVKKVIAPSNRKVIVEGQKQPRRAKVPHDKMHRKLRTQKRRPKKQKNHRDIGVKSSVELRGRGDKKISKIFIPDNKKVIVKGVSDFILDESEQVTTLKNINYYKGKKLKELVFTFDNSNSQLDFDFELFNPSMPVDYLQATSLNLNDRITVSGGENVSYSDVLFNLIGNPTLIVNAQFVFSGPSITSQISQSLKYKNKEITDKQKLFPQQISQQIDTYQFLANRVYFNIAEQINRPFCPDGMDVLEYKVLAGMTVTFGFYYKQISMKKVFFPEARRSKGLL